MNDIEEAEDDAEFDIRQRPPPAIEPVDKIQALKLAQEAVERTVNYGDMFKIIKYGQYYQQVQPIEEIAKVKLTRFGAFCKNLLTKSVHSRSAAPSSTVKTSVRGTSLTSTSAYHPC